MPSLIRPLIPFALATLMGACSSSRTPPAKGPPEVGVQTVATQRLAVQRSMPGRTVAHMVSDVRPQVGGILQKRLFTEGQDVVAGQVLYQIDPQTYQAAFDNAKGTLAQAEAAVMSTRPKAERYRKLTALDAVSKQDGDDAEATLREDEAAVVVAKAALETARINLGYTRIVAPISGRIATSAYTPGALVSAGQDTALTTIQQLDPIYVDVTQSSAQLLTLRKQLASGALTSVDGKAKVDILLEDGSTYARQGTLEFVGSSVDTGTGNVSLRAVVPNPDGLLLPGAYVSASLPVAIDDAGILVPQAAVTRDSRGQAVVKLVGADSKVAERVVQTGEARGDQWVVSGGLKAGERLVVDGGSAVTAGESVKPVDAALTANAAPTTPATASSASGASAANAAP